MNLTALMKNKVVQPVSEIKDDYERQLELIVRDLQQAKIETHDPAWRYVMGFNALAGLSRLVLLLQGLKATGLYGTSVSINLMVHFANSKLSLPPKDDLIRMRNRRNELMYRNAVSPEKEEIEELIAIVEKIYSILLVSPWRNHPYSQCTFGLSLLSTKYWSAS